MLLVAVILFSASMVIPALKDSNWKIYMQGGATGLIMASIVSIITLIIDNLKESRK